MDRLDQQRPYWRDRDDEPDADHEVAAFQRRHRSLSERVERVVMQLVLLGLVALVLVQTLQVIPAVRKLSNLVEAMDGVPYSQVTAWQNGAGTSTAPETMTPVAATTAASASVTVQCMTKREAPRADLLVDGKVVGHFSAGSVTAQIAPGQILSVDGSAYSEPLTFRVVAAPGLSSPALGTNVTTRANRQVLGTARASD